MPAIPAKVGLARVVAEIRVDPAVVYFESAQKLAQQIEPDFRYWETDGQHVRFTDPEKRAAVALRHDALVVEMDLPADVGAFRRTFDAIAKIYLSSAHVKSIRRFGMRAHFFHNPDFRFDELLAVFGEKLLRLPTDESRVFDGKMADVMFNVIVTETDELSAHMIAGPVRREELARWTRSIDYTVGRPPEPIEYPAVSCFIDLDVYTMSVANQHEVEQLSAASGALIEDRVRRFVRYVFEEGAK